MESSRSRPCPVKAGSGLCLDLVARDLRGGAGSTTVAAGLPMLARARVVQPSVIGPQKFSEKNEPSRLLSARDSSPDRRSSYLQTLGVAAGPVACAGDETNESRVASAEPEGRASQPPVDVPHPHCLAEGANHRVHGILAEQPQWHLLEELEERIRLATGQQIDSVGGRSQVGGDHRDPSRVRLSERPNLPARPGIGRRRRPNRPVAGRPARAHRESARTASSIGSVQPENRVATPSGRRSPPRRAPQIPSRESWRVPSDRRRLAFPGAASPAMWHRSGRTAAGRRGTPDSRRDVGARYSARSFFQPFADPSAGRFLTRQLIHRDGLATRIGRKGTFVDHRILGLEQVPLAAVLPLDLQ